MGCGVACVCVYGHACVWLARSDGKRVCGYEWGCGVEYERVGGYEWGYGVGVVRV